MGGTVPIFIVYALLTLWIWGFVLCYRQQITCMAGMMSAMCLSMTVGLGAGSLIAALYPGHFFQACMISMLLAGMIGVIAGLPVSTMAVLDGLLSGIMGGMMGAMLMGMMPAPYLSTTLKISAVLTASIIFILLIMLLGEVRNLGHSRVARMFFSPQTMFAVDILFYLFIFCSNPLPDHSDNRGKSQDLNHHEMSSSMNDRRPLADRVPEFTSAWPAANAEHSARPIRS